MRVYHVTSSEAAQAIAAQGFRDSAGRFLTATHHAGVFVSDRPLWLESSIELEHLACFEICVDEQYLAGCEWIEEGKGYREWLVPAAVLNAGVPARLLTADEIVELIDA